MRRLTRRQLILIAIAVVVVAAVVFAFIPDPVPVQTVQAEQKPLQVVVEEEGVTEVADRYAITAPVSAFLRRIELEVGDPLTRGQPVARLEPPRTPILDPRTRAEASAAVDAARAALTQAEASAARALADRDRTERLAAGGSATRQALEQARSAAAEATAAVARARADLNAANAALRRTEGAGALAVQNVLTAPAAGRVLAVRRRSEGPVNPGDTLIVVGNTEHLEIRADVLSQDAVRIQPGTRVLVEQWGGDSVLEATVRRVEPQGVTTISSLGVEEQRVLVVAGLVSPPELWAGKLGSRYRVLARFVVWEQPNVLQVPSSALFRVGKEWAVFVVEDGRAVRKTVTIGQQAGLVTQIVSGIDAGAEVIVHPANTVEEGVRVEAEREQSAD